VFFELAYFRISNQKVTTTLRTASKSFTSAEYFGGEVIFGILGSLSEHTAFVGLAGVWGNLLFCLEPLAESLLTATVHSVRFEELRRLVFQNLFLKIFTTRSVGFAVAQLVEALCYKPEVCGFDSRWCHWNFLLTILPATLWPWG
jgi:hypothetical protein